MEIEILASNIAHDRILYHGLLIGSLKASAMFFMASIIRWGWKGAKPITKNDFLRMLKYALFIGAIVALFAVKAYF